MLVIRYLDKHFLEDSGVADHEMVALREDTRMDKVEDSIAL